jgi:translation initiation factor 2B subunit (eIF-2B alpha/beta/delta family)
MKLTVKAYEIKTEENRTLNNQIRNFEEGGSWDELEALKAQVKELEIELAKTDKLNISFMCGSRLFYREVSIIGKTMFDGSTKITKGNGYRAVEVIETITDKMKADMIDDSYYY